MLSIVHVLFIVSAKLFQGYIIDLKLIHSYGEEKMSIETRVGRYLNCITILLLNIIIIKGKIQL